jgi:hypothetical protein
MNSTKEIIGIAFIFGICVYFSFKIFWRRKCDNCKIYMKRQINKSHEIIHKCPVCGSEKK